MSVFDVFGCEAIGVAAVELTREIGDHRFKRRRARCAVGGTFGNHRTRVERNHRTDLRHGVEVERREKSVGHEEEDGV